MDGGYGVGKTHLLAAAFHAAPGHEKAYLTFQELVHRIGALGMEAASREFSGLRLLCLDEFELDDPGNTLMVKRCLEGLFGNGASVLTTSNTPPEAQGEGRFNAQDFRREIQGIASRFQVVGIEGSDYRRRENAASLPGPAEFTQELARVTAVSNAVVCSFEELLEVLRQLHPIRYRPLLARMANLFVSKVARIKQQHDALRFVHFIDQLYDMQVGLRATGELGLDSIFDSTYRHGAYQRKFERCISRLGELIEEPLAAAASTRPSSELDRAHGFD